jgi:hypothetical protein
VQAAGRGSGTLAGFNAPTGLFGLTDEFGAEFEADPPSQLALAGMARRKNEGEFRRNFGIIGNDLDAAVRDVRDRAVARQRAGPELDFRELFAKLTFASASIC